MALLETSQFLVTVKTDEMYLAIFDVLSVANSLNRWKEAMSSSYAQSAPEHHKQLLYFNSVWSDYAASKSLLAWTFNFDGVYHVKVVVSPVMTDMVGLEAAAFIGVEDEAAQLQCPSGELIITSLSNLGNQPNISAIVPPGLYKVSLMVDWEQQDKHQFLERIEDYPSQEGPDWVLYLQKLIE